MAFCAFDLTPGFGGREDSHPTNHRIPGFLFSPGLSGRLGRSRPLPRGRLIFGGNCAFFFCSFSRFTKPRWQVRWGCKITRQRRRSPPPSSRVRSSTTYTTQTTRLGARVGWHGCRVDEPAGQPGAKPDNPKTRQPASPTKMCLGQKDPLQHRFRTAAEGRRNTGGYLQTSQLTSSTSPPWRRVGTPAPPPSPAASLAASAVNRCATAS